MIMKPRRPENLFGRFAHRVLSTEKVQRCQALGVVEAVPWCCGGASQIARFD